MLGKQFMLDIAIVLALPALGIGVYFMAFRDTSGPLLSAGSEILNLQADAPGTRTKQALQTLNTITLNDSLFKDPAFLSLTTYTVPIPTSELSREYPFTPTPEIADMLKRAKNTTKNSTQTKAESISVKLDMLKTSATR